MNIDNSNDLHTAQWERRSTWLAYLRDYKRNLQSSGVQGFDLLEAMATLSINHRLATQKDRCRRCWHVSLHCICSGLQDLQLQLKGKGLIDVKICILMHHKEYMSAGNSAKLLLLMCHSSAELYVFGKKGDVDRLFNDLKAEHVKPIILWPGSHAISTAEVLDSIVQKENSGAKENNIRAINAVVLDGTYNQARNMYKSLKKKWGADIPATVALRPISESVFHRAQKNYGRAHLQHNQDEEAILRVSTAEACGVLLQELGCKDVLDRVVDAVRMNNDALIYSRHHLTKSDV